MYPVHFITLEIKHAKEFNQVSEICDSSLVSTCSVQLLSMGGAEVWRCQHVLVEPSSRVVSCSLPLGSAWSSFWRSVNETVNGLCQVSLWVRMREAIAQARDLLFTTWRNGVQCAKYSCMKLPYMAQQVGNVYFYRLTEIKELSGSLWWMHEGRNLLKPVVGCGLFSMWSWWESRVTKIWGSGHDHGLLLFLFTTTGFHIARSGIFWTPTFVL